MESNQICNRFGRLHWAKEFDVSPQVSLLRDSNETKEQLGMQAKIQITKGIVKRYKMPHLHFFIVFYIVIQSYSRPITIVNDDKRCV